MVETWNCGKGVKGKLWKEFQRNQILTILVMSEKCHDFEFVQFREEEERQDEGGSCVGKVLVCDCERACWEVCRSPVYARGSVNMCEGDVWEMCEISLRLLMGGVYWRFLCKVSIKLLRKLKLVSVTVK